MDEAGLIKRACAGDTAAFGRLVERHESLVFGLAFAIVADRAEAEDVAQDTFLAAFRSLETFDARRGRFVDWLTSIARNRALNRLKSPSRTRRRAMPEDVVAPAGETIDVDFAELDRALASLPATQRVAFVLAEIEGIPHAAIAELEGVPAATIKTRVHRARTKLRAALAPLRRHS